MCCCELWWICLNAYLYTTYLPLATISWKYNRPSGNRLKQQFLRNIPWWKLLTNDRSVIIFYQSCDYISSPLNKRIQCGRNWKLVLYRSVLAVSRSDFIQSLSSCLLTRDKKAKWSAAITISFEIFEFRSIPSMFSMLFSGREQIVRDLGLNRIMLICILWCHFLEVSLISVASIKDLNARNFRWNPAKHTIASKAKKPASPADVTSALAPDLLSGGREPELIGSFAKIWWIYSIRF